MSNSINIEFDWSVEPKEWAGYSQTDLVELVNNIADTFHVSNENKHKICVHFDDYGTFMDQGGYQKAYYARITSKWNEGKTRIIECKVDLNRSQEGFLECAQRVYPDFLKLNVEEEYQIENPLIPVFFRETWEGLVWLIAEEIHHATFLLGKDPKKINLAAEQYLVDMARFHKLPDNLDDYKEDNLPYSLNLMEVSASRDVLKLLENMTENNSQRAIFKDIYKLSLEIRMCITPRFDLIYKSLFVPTGYIP